MRSRTRIVAVFILLICMTGLAPHAHAAAPVKLTALDAAAGDRFGIAVSISRDTVIVGAHLDADAGAFSGSAYIYRWIGTGWIQEAKLTASDGAIGDQFGISVSIDGNTAIVGASRDDDAGTDSGSFYVFTRIGSTWTQQAKLIADDGAAFDHFGVSIAIDDDTAIVGADFHDDVGSDTGTAYVFTRTGTSWTQQAKLTASNAAANDRFGYAVSVDSDTALIGARLDDDLAGIDQGSAYIFTRTGTAWTQQAKLIADDATTLDQFGFSVSIDTDTVLIGAFLHEDTVGLDNHGVAYIFTRMGTTWTQQAKLTASDVSANDGFGYSVSIDVDTALVGSIFDDDAAGSDQGSAHIFTRAGTTWTQQATLVATDPSASDFFGQSVSLDADTALVGAPLHDETANSDQGASYIFERVGNVWINPDQKILANDAAASDQFGSSVALDGNTAIIGSIFDDDAGSDSGSAYIYIRTNGKWIFQARLTASDAAAGDFFGVSVSINGDTAIIGARFDDDAAGTDQGSAYIFTRTGTIWTQQAKLTAFDAAATDQFGISVSIESDTAIVGAFGKDSFAGLLQGAAYVYTRAGTVWSQQAKLVASDGAASDQFGVSVSLSGNTTIVGANFDSDGGLRSGSAYIFERVGLFWGQQAKLTDPDAALGDTFGNSVSIDGDTAIVGSPGKDSLGLFTNTGAAFVFNRTGISWTLQAILTDADTMGQEQLGSVVSISGDIVLAGSSADSGPGGIRQGSASMFRRIGSTWSQRTRLLAPDAEFDDQLGNALAIDGNTALVGAQLDDDTAGSDQGSVWFFSIDDECLPSIVLNTTAGTSHTLLSTAFAAAAPLDSLVATPASFWNEPLINPSPTPLFMSSTGTIRLPYTGSMTLSGSSLLASAPGRDIVLYAPTIVELNASLLSNSNLQIFDSFTLQGGNLQALTTDIQGTLSGFGGVNSDIVNQGNVTIQADTQVVGNYTNNATTTIQNGTLTILGTLIDNGAIIGDFTGLARAEPSGFYVEQDYVAGAGANLSLLNAIAKFGMNADIAINDNTRFDMATSEFRMVGLASTTQTIEVMSIDIGNSQDGLDRTIAGHFPIGTLKIGPTPTTVNLIDTHDNDNLGQATKEALYVTNLIINAGTTLNTNGCTIYYSTLTNNGSVDTPSNLVQIAACIADITGDGFVNGADLGFLLGSWAQPGVSDLNADGTTDGADLGLLLGAWGPCP